MKKTRITDLNYADDIAFFAESRNILRDMIEALCAESEKAGLHINIGVTKTAWMAVGKGLKGGCQESALVTKFGAIPEVVEYRYLGHKKNSQQISLTLQERVALSWKAFHRLKPLWNSSLSIALRLRIFSALVNSVLIYGSASLVATKKELKEVDIEVNKMRRMATGMPLWDGRKRTPTAALYRGESLFSTQLRVNRAKLVGHLLRHDSSFADVMLWNENDKARIKSLSEATAEDLGIDVAEMFDLAKNREEWKLKVERLRTRLEPTATYKSHSSQSCRSEVENIFRSERSASEKWSALQFYEEGPVSWPEKDLRHLYCDGSVRGSKEALCAGISVVLFENERCTFIEQQELSKQDRTPIRAELRAFLQALTIGHQREGDFVVHVDSEHVWQFWHRHRISFQLDGYTTLENADLLKKIGDKAQCIFETANVHVVKVRAHCENARNDLADRVAYKAAEGIVSFLLIQEIAPPPACENAQNSNEAVRHESKECAHRCKDKEACGHKCCKRHLRQSKE